MAAPCFAGVNSHVTLAEVAPVPCLCIAVAGEKAVAAEIFVDIPPFGRRLAAAVGTMGVTQELQAA